MNRTLKFSLLPLIFFALSSAVCAQEEEDKKPASPTLAQLLPGLPWDAAQQGVLLAVAPERALIAVKPNEPAPQNVREAAGRAKRVLRRFGGVAALGPEQVLTFNPRPGPPDLSKERNGFKALAGTLSAAQWREMASERGLAYDSLSREQRVLWEKVVPDPLPIVWAKGYSGPTPPPVTHAPQTFTGVERRGVRLHASLLTSVDARYAKESGYHSFYFHKNEYETNKEFPRIDFRKIRDKTENDKTEYGQLLGERIPARLKSSDLNPQSVTRSVSLQKEGETPLTVGTLVTRIAQAEQIELRADQRLVKLSVIANGTEAQSGDVLRGLCWAIGGAVRQITDETGKPVFILTNDHDGFGTRRAIIDDWQMAAQRQEIEEEENTTEALRQANLLDLLKFDADEPVSLTPDIIKRIIAPRKEQRGRALEVPITELPAAQRTVLQQAADRLAEVDNGRFAVTPDKVRVSVNMWFGYVLPDGTVMTTSPGQEIEDLTPDVPSVPAPPSLSGTSLVVAVQTPEEARAAVGEALKQKIGAVWLEVAQTAAGREAFRAGVEAGKAANVPVWAVVRLLRPNPEIPGLPLDVNVAGETSRQYALRRWNRREAASWVTPGDLAAQNRADFAASLVKAAPNTAGIVFRDLLPPGYRERGNSGGGRWNGNPSPYQEGTAANLGYGTPARLAFLRDKGADPIDVIAYDSYSQWTSSLFDANAFADEWRTWRADRGVAFLSAVRSRMQKAVPNIPVLWEGFLTYSTHGDRYDKRDGCAVFLATPDNAVPADLFAARTSGPSENAPLSTRMRPKAGKVWLDIGGQGKPGAPSDVAKTPQERAGKVAARMGEGWDGLVLDLSYLPFTDAVKALAAIAEAAAGNKERPAP